MILNLKKKKKKYSRIAQISEQVTRHGIGTKVYMSVETDLSFKRFQPSCQPIKIISEQLNYCMELLFEGGTYNWNAFNRQKSGLLT